MKAISLLVAAVATVMATARRGRPAKQPARSPLEQGWYEPY